MFGQETTAQTLAALGTAQKTVLRSSTAAPFWPFGLAQKVSHVAWTLLQSPVLLWLHTDPHQNQTESLGKVFFLAKGQDEGQPNRREVTKGKLPLCKVAKVLLSAHLHHLDWAPISWPLFMAFSLKGTGRARKNFHKVLTEMRWSCCQCTNGTASHSGVLHILARNHNRIGLNPASSNSWVPCHLPNSQIEDFTFCTSVFLKTKASFNFKTTSKAALTRKLYLTDWGKNMQNQVW